MDPDVSGPELVAAVSNGGGLRIMQAQLHPPPSLRQAIRRVRQLTDKPFGVNFLLHFPCEEGVTVCVEERVPVLSFFWGDPTPLVPIAHQGGAIVMHTVGDVAEARRAVDAGVDVVVAQGWEAGGHVRGEVATLVLVPAVVDAVGPIPVVAAGGIGDGRGLAAVLTVGASAGWLGTRFVMATETPAHPTYRDLLAGAGETSTVHSSLFDVGWPDAPHRTLRNSTVEAWEAAGRPPSGTRPGEGEVIATWDDDGTAIVRYASSSANEAVSGDIEALPLWAGQSVAFVDDIRPAGDIVRRLADEAAAALRAGAELVSG